MRAIFANSPGLLPQEVPEPAVGSGEVLIEVAAAGVNRADLLQVAGHYPAGEEPLGLEVAGTVLAAGGPAGEHLVGKTVWALVAGGGYAELVAAPVAQVRPLPSSSPFTQGAALPEALATAWFNLVWLAGLRAGERVLIHGGSGGVGHVAIQVARRLGATVLTTCGPGDKADRCRRLGAHEAIDYSDDVAAQVALFTAGQGVDVILDVLGAGGLAANLAMAARGGRIAVIGLQKGRTAQLDLVALMEKRVTLTGSLLRSASAVEKARIVAEASLLDVTAQVHAALPFEEASRAHALLDEDATFGKVVLTLR